MNLSEGTVREQYDLIRDTLAKDDALPEGVEPRSGIRRFADFWIQADLFEEAMRHRGIEFEKIKW
jgi:hypothetical protein